MESVGITISNEQADYARNICKGLPVEIRIQDYRDLKANDQFDRIVSVGMFEHVGFRNYDDYFKVWEIKTLHDILIPFHKFQANCL